MGENRERTSVRHLVEEGKHSNQSRNAVRSVGLKGVKSSMKPRKLDRFTVAQTTKKATSVKRDAYGRVSIIGDGKVSGLPKPKNGKLFGSNRRVTNVYVDGVLIKSRIEILGKNGKVKLKIKRHQGLKGAGGGPKVTRKGIRF